MIKANELRIGNWVFMKGVAIPERMVTIGINDFKYAESEYMNPIPLTPEILQKCGFEKYSSDMDCSIYGNHGDDSDLFLQFDWRYRDRGYTPMIKSEEWEIIGMNIKYLHQLQNLYFALTGEELNIQL